MSFRTLLIKNRMNPELLEFMDGDTLALYNEDKLSFKCMRRNFLFVHFTTQIAKKIDFISSFHYYKRV